MVLILWLAEREGFEPSRDLTPCSFSKAVRSATLTPLHFLFFLLALSDPDIVGRVEGRRDRDSKSRRTCILNSFQDCRLKPLSHLSRTLSYKQKNYSKIKYFSQVYCAVIFAMIYSS